MFFTRAILFRDCASLFASEDKAGGEMRRFGAGRISVGARSRLCPRAQAVRRRLQARTFIGKSTSVRDSAG